MVRIDYMVRYCKTQKYVLIDRGKIMHYFDVLLELIARWDQDKMALCVFLIDI